MRRNPNHKHVSRCSAARGKTTGSGMACASASACSLLEDRPVNALEQVRIPEEQERADPQAVFAPTL